MTELVFYYGTMGSSKTANALMQRFQYIERGKQVLLLKPAIDTRDDYTDKKGNKITVVKSRIGIQAKAIVINSTQSILNLVYGQPVHPEVVICDEAQFFTADQIDQLKALSQNGISVFCYGLRTDFQTKLFPGSKRLFEVADSVQELKSVCECGRPATVNARFKNDQLVIDGEQVEIGGNDLYRPMCWTCWKRATIKVSTDDKQFSTDINELRDEWESTI